MLTKIVPAIILGGCLWAVLNRNLKTRTLGTVALSMLALLAARDLCS